MKAPLLLLPVIVLLLATDKPADPVKKDREALQGSWKAVEGKEEARLVFSGDAFTVKGKDKDVYKGTFKIDPAAKPHAIDMMVMEDNEKGTYKGKTSLGIYELDGDTLKWCANEPGKDERPKEFVKNAGGTRYLFLTLKREKK